MTNNDRKADKRWYDDACGTALAMELVGERWSLLIVRELMFGPRRFGELRGGLPGISANVLTQRLEGMEEVGILVRRKLPPPANVQVYELTPWGYQSETAIQELGRWAVRSRRHDPTLPLSAAAIMMSFRTMIDRSRSGERPMQVGFDIAPDAFVAAIDAHGIAVRRAQPDSVDLRLAAQPPVLAAIVYGGLPVAAAERDGALAVTGDRGLLAHFVTLFPLPPKTG
ncbi:winged helix-turn-helix transcriptional regulator [Sphingomonas sanxanigenens]|uniref:winged helix-turn-helix transcriptional regulator n=1 Tax=Sphingomonas sanxanigenens TaxID=397260 RepID=UPI0004B4C1C9|nr:helix-turn-helix domain-containing protein [Sphingomonas sanxanigenens]